MSSSSEILHDVADAEPALLDLLVQVEERSKVTRDSSTA
jgi:hypothetical protein